MNRLNVKEVLKNLSIERELFHNEKDFQFAFAWKIKQMYGYDVRFECCVPPVTDDDKRKYIDLLIKDENNEGILFELKYKTRALKSGVYMPKGEVFNLKNQSARDLGAYSVFSDLSRIEHLVGQNLNGCRITKAYCIMLTNDGGYKNGFRKGSYFYHFGLEENRYIKASQPMRILLKKGKDKREWIKDFPNIELEHDYKIEWGDYSNILFELILEVPTD